jgi:Tol biopolymer transport system component
MPVDVESELARLGTAWTASVAHVDVAEVLERTITARSQPLTIGQIDIVAESPAARHRGRVLAVAAVVVLLVAAVVVGLVWGNRMTQPSSPTPIPTAIANGWVAFAASRSDSDSDDIYLVREGSNPRRITGSATDATDEICPAFSPDASQLLFGRAAGTYDEGYHDAALVVADVAADGELSEVATIPLDGESPPPCGIWSPDGRWIAFGVDPPLIPGSVSGVGNGREPTWNSVDEVWVVDTQSDDIRRLIVSSVTDFDWAPDDNELTMASDGVVVYSVTADELRPLGDAQDVGSVAWSPDGQTIAYMRGPGDGVTTGDLWLMDADGTNERILVPGISAVHGLGPVWSPDGERIAYQRDLTICPRGGPCHENSEVVLLTVNPDEPLEPAGSQVVIPPPQTTGPDGQPLSWYPWSVTWSPDGTTLLYRAWAVSFAGVVAVPLDGETPPVVLSGDLGTDVYSGIPWLPIQTWGRQQVG